VRGCARPLVRGPIGWTCSAGHAFDVARAGHVNLLQPQDRRSLAAGDALGAIEARRRCERGGLGLPPVELAADLVRSHGVRAGAWAVDVGCGTGRLLAGLCGRVGLAGIGIDLSKRALQRAAREHPQCTWVVANADRRLPLLDESVGLALSVTAPRPAAELARVLVARGVLLVGVIGAQDLVELRAAVQGEGRLEDRAERVAAQLAPAFREVERRSVRERRRLGRAEIADVLAATYRGGRAARAERAAALEALEVTLALDLLVLVKA
jgi:23S rRNA (guanine745-N1)-methyltransferase